MNVYPEETLDPDYDDGTMPGNVATLAEAVIGHKIVSVDQTDEVEDGLWRWEAVVITLDDGTKVKMYDTDDCCAFTELESFLLHADKIDHMILGVGTTDGYTTWHIYAEDVLEMRVGWSCGNPFYYGYGFDIRVVPAS